MNAHNPDIRPRRAVARREADNLRRELEAAIEAAIAALDVLDGDADLEPTHGAPEGHPAFGGSLWAFGDDGECEAACEDDGWDSDREPDVADAEVEVAQWRP